MSSTADRPVATPAAHAERERETGLRHELVEGELFAMTGGTPAHAQIGTALVGTLFAALGDGPCRVFGPDLKLRIADDIVYPDASVHCGELVLHPDDPTATVAPVLVAEVLSPSTEAWDRGGKFARYRSIPALRHVLFVDPERQVVEHYERGEADRWVLTVKAAPDVLALSGLDVALPVGVLFRNLPSAGATAR